MNIKRILCPIDFSESNRSATEYACTLARASNAEVVYLHVSQPDVPFSTYAQVDMEREETRLLKQLESTVDHPEDIPADFAIEFGVAADQILEFSNENNIDLIVMGTHGRTGFRRILMGSVVEAVIRMATRPVLAVKAKTGADGDTKEISGKGRSAEQGT